MNAIRHKADYYALAARGVLGNTVERFFSLDDWKRRSSTYSSWGVQTTRVPGGPCRLNCPTEEVEATWAKFLPYVPVVSPMLSACIPTLWAGDAWDSPTGLSLHGLLAPPLGFDWRASMKTDQRSWHGTAARALLRSLMTPDSYEDMTDVFERYPGHVYEVSVFERCVGTRPGRNAVVWEVRAY